MKRLSDIHRSTLWSSNKQLWRLPDITTRVTALRVDHIAASRNAVMEGNAAVSVFSQWCRHVWSVTSQQLKYCIQVLSQLKNTFLKIISIVHWLIYKISTIVSSKWRRHFIYHHKTLIIVAGGYAPDDELWSSSVWSQPSASVWLTIVSEWNTCNVFEKKDRTKRLFIDRFCPSVVKCSDVAAGKWNGVKVHAAASWDQCRSWWNPVRCGHTGDRNWTCSAPCRDVSRLTPGSHDCCLLSELQHEFRKPRCFFRSRHTVSHLKHLLCAMATKTERKVQRRERNKN